MIEKNIDKKLAIELITNYNSNDDYKESLVGGPNPLWHRAGIKEGRFLIIFFFINKKKNWNDLNQNNITY